MNIPPIEITPIEITTSIKCGPGNPLLIIAGPCQIESLDHCLIIAEKLQELCSKLGLNYVFKSSFDKANRTSLAGTRGIGIDEGLRILDEVRSRLKVAVLTDIHNAEQAEIDLINAYYKKGAIQDYKTELRHLASTLGGVRDRDRALVVLADLAARRQALA